MSAEAESTTATTVNVIETAKACMTDRPGPNALAGRGLDQGREAQEERGRGLREEYGKGRQGPKSGDVEVHVDELGDLERHDLDRGRLADQRHDAFSVTEMEKTTASMTDRPGAQARRELDQGHRALDGRDDPRHAQEDRGDHLGDPGVHHDGERRHERKGHVETPDSPGPNGLLLLDRGPDS